MGEKETVSDGKPSRAKTAMWCLRFSSSSPSQKLAGEGRNWLRVEGSRWNCEGCCSRAEWCPREGTERWEQLPTQPLRAGRERHRGGLPCFGEGRGCIYLPLLGNKRMTNHQHFWPQRAETRADVPFQKHVWGQRVMEGGEGAPWAQIC